MPVIGPNLALGAHTLRQGGWVPHQLFSNDEPGAWFDPSDLSSMYQGRTGTMAAAVGSPVGQILDKSGNGNHAVAVSDEGRAILARHPFGGTRNLLTYTEDFSNGVWDPTSCSVTSNAAVAPDGSMTADKIVGAVSASTNHFVKQDITGDLLEFTWVVYAKAAELGWLCLNANDATNRFTYFNLLDGTIGTNAAGNTAAILDVGDGWYRCQVSRTAVNTALSMRLFLADGDNSNAFSGDGSSGIYVWGAQLELGSTVTAYQKVTSQFDVTEAGVSSVYALKYDGVDDGYVTPTITPGTDKVQVFAGVRKLSDATDGIIAEMSTSSANNGMFDIFAPGSSGAARYQFLSKGTSSVVPFTTSTEYNAPTTSVIAALGDISGDRATLRIDGEQAAQSTSDQGTGNYLAYPLYIGRRGGTSLPSNGQEYGLIVRFGPNMDAATLAKVEAYMARRTGVVL